MAELYLSTEPVQQIIDGNSYLRAKLYGDTMGHPVRQILQEIELSHYPVVWVFDGFDCNARRRVLYSEYKRKRVLPSDDLFQTMRFIKDLLAWVPRCVLIEVPGWEADDVIATIVRKNAKFRNPVRIVTTDKDYWQLGVHPTVSITANHPGIPPEFVRLHKTLVGDPSDNIPGFKGFGPKRWEELNHGVAHQAFARRSLADMTPERIGMPPSTFDRLKEQFQQLLVYWDIIGLWQVPTEEIENNIIVSVPNLQRVNERLAEFYQ